MSNYFKQNKINVKILVPYGSYVVVLSVSFFCILFLFPAIGSHRQYSVLLLSDFWSYVDDDGGYYQYNLSATPKNS